MHLGYGEFQIKLNSIPESEPLYTIMKSRVINLNKIKDKNERQYWSELKRINRIPDLYMPVLKRKEQKINLIGGTNGKKMDNFQG